MPTNVGKGLENRGRRRAAPALGPVSEDAAHRALIAVVQSLDHFEVMLGNCVAILRCYGRSWAYVGSVTGMTSEGARQRFQDMCDERGLPRRITAEVSAQLVSELPAAAEVLGPLATMT
jgi:hypothetical protein